MFTRTIIYSCVLSLLLTCVYTQYNFDCEKDFCAKKVKCLPLNCEKGSRIIENATICGCCHVCVRPLKLEDQCDTQVFSDIPDKECGPGLICDKTTSKCVDANTECIKDQKKYNELKEGNLQFGKTRPECDEFGFYKPVVCISDVLCYCVNKHGKRIFGTDLAANKDTMHCNCSRDFDGFPKTKTVENFLRCLPNGNYDKLQCSDEWCYCMQNTSQSAGYVAKANTTLKSLQCYNENRHGEYDPMLRSKCLQKRYKLQQEIKRYADEGVTVIGVDLPQCELDGSYAPIQCKKDRCHCVNKNGKIYDGYNVPRRESKGMNCRCVRETEMIHEEKDKNRNMALFGKFKCARNGSYEKTQIVGSTSIVVSDMGYQLKQYSL